MSSDQTISVHQPFYLTREFLTWGAFLLALATILGAWGFQLIGGYTPCQLCLGQRIPYYVGVPIAAFAVWAAVTGRVTLNRILLLAVAAVFLWGTYLAVSHTGVEYGWWAGPTDCGAAGGPITSNVGGLLNELQTAPPPVSCTAVQWRFPGEWGLSFAGWNAVVSIAIVTAALLGALRRPAR